MQKNNLSLNSMRGDLRLRHSRMHFVTVVVRNDRFLFARRHVKTALTLQGEAIEI